jgi:hypothetical protein
MAQPTAADALAAAIASATTATTVGNRIDAVETQLINITAQLQALLTAAAALAPSMQQVVEVALNIPPTTPLTTDEILDLIADYSPLDKYGITPRRFIRRRVFFISFQIFSPIFLGLEKWRPKYRITPTPPVLSYGANGLFILLFIYLIFKKEFLYSNPFNISLI